MSTWDDQLFDENKEEIDRVRSEPIMANTNPELWDFFAGKFDVSGKCQRGPGSIQIWVEDGRFKSCWKIKLAGIYGFTTLDCQKPLMDALSEALTSRRIEWRKDGGKRRA